MKNGFTFRMAGLLALASMLVGCDSSKNADGAGGGEISVISSPESAKVLCNGKTYGLTPTSVPNLRPGRYLVEVQKEGFATARKTVELLSGQSMGAVEFNLEPIRGIALIHTDPPGAEVEISGASRGSTPLLLTDMTIGEHRVQLNKRGYLPKEVIMKVADRRPVKVDEPLVSNSATVIFTSLPLGADVNIDGIRRGTTPVTVNDISAGRHQIEVSLAGYYKYEEEVSLSPGDAVEIDAPLKPIPGSLRVVTSPAGAKVYINNQFKGPAPIEVPSLVPGDYRVTVELAGYAPDSRTVTVGNAAARVEEFRMIKNSGIVQIITQPAGVEVFMDGEEVGETQAGRSDVISEPLQVDFVSAGPHRIQLTKKGYTKWENVVEVSADKITPLRVSMKRIFIPNVIIIQGANADQQWRGRLDKKYDNGDVRIERAPGVFKLFKNGEYLRIDPIRENSGSN